RQAAPGFGELELHPEDTRAPATPSDEGTPQGAQHPDALPLAPVALAVTGPGHQRPPPALPLPALERPPAEDVARRVHDPGLRHPTTGLFTDAPHQARPGVPLFRSALPVRGACPAVSGRLPLPGCQA